MIINHIANNLDMINKRIEASCALISKKISDIQLIPVSKGHSADTIREAYALGLRHFGESYIQEWLQKQIELKDLSDINWHLLGHLQSNKAKFLVGKCHYVHSIDRISVVEVLERLLLKGNIFNHLNVFIEMAIDTTDINKSGATFIEAEQICQKLKNSQTINWLGFMGIGPVNKTTEELANLYKNFIHNSNLLWEKYHSSVDKQNICQISLGMSDDLEIAIESGSTMIRVGSALFR